MSGMDLLFYALFTLAICLAVFGLTACAHWTTTRLKAALGTDHPSWIAAGISFLSWTGFFAIGRSLNSEMLNIRTIAFFVLVPHLIIVAFEHLGFFKDAGDDGTHDTHTSGRA